jgi:hypothetical protein
MLRLPIPDLQIQIFETLKQEDYMQEKRGTRALVQMAAVGRCLALRRSWHVDGRLFICYQFDNERMETESEN